jgi:dihydroorotase-like cyclic amidohydrolase
VTDTSFDLVIRGGTVVTPETAVTPGTVVSPGGQQDAAIGIRDGRIAQLGGEMAAPQELDARGLLVLPGGVDAHVHLIYAALAQAAGQQEPAWVDDFWSG